MLNNAVCRGWGAESCMWGGSGGRGTTITLFLNPQIISRMYKSIDPKIKFSATGQVIKTVQQVCVHVWKGETETDELK